VILVRETEHFTNTGYGWTCKHCAAQQARNLKPTEMDDNALPRFFREGEAEEPGALHLASAPLARWQDASRRTLFCPQCCVEELIAEEQMGCS